jgi:hypothetical protein
MEQVGKLFGKSLETATNWMEQYSCGVSSIEKSHGIHACSLGHQQEPQYKFWLSWWNYWRGTMAWLERRGKRMVSKTRNNGHGQFTVQFKKIKHRF